MSQLTISEVEFNSIKDNLKTYLSAKTEFQDISFEGSGINFLLDVLAYVTHYMSFYLNMSVNEVFLSTAQLRKNITARAKELNYIPRRKTGSIATIEFEIKTLYKPTNPSTVITIPKYTDFVISGFHFFTTEDYQLTFANNYKIDEMSLRQGTYQTESHTSDGTSNQTLKIENDSVDEETLEVYVDGELWTNENDLTSVDENSEMYSIELDDDDFVEVIFGDDIIGKIPPVGTTIQFIWTQTEGEDGNGFSNFILDDVLTDNFLGTYDASKVTVTVLENALGGADEETDLSIKTNAPKFYESQGSLVTATDYEAFLSQHQYVESVNVYGGNEDEYNPVYGNVYIAIKPVGALYLTPAQKIAINSYIEGKNILTIHPIIIDINYIHVDISGVIYFNQIYEAELPSVRDDVSQEITDYFDELTPFDSLFKMAKFTTAINNLEQIENTNLSIQPYFYFSKVGTGNYYWNLENEIVVGSIDCDIITGLLNEGFYDDEDGNILTKKSGNAVIGTIDYTNGVIEILPNYAISATEPDDGFRVNFSVDNDDVFYTKNRKITLGSVSLTYTRFV